MIALFKKRAEKAAIKINKKVKIARIRLKESRKMQKKKEEKLKEKKRGDTRWPHQKKKS